MGACEDRWLPDQSKWSHEKKAELSKKRGTVNPAFFERLHAPFNRLGRDLKLLDATYVFALAAHESGWLNEENAWLSNPFGLTMAGRDNLGFDSLDQAVSYWKCKYGERVMGARSMDGFVAGLRAAGYNTAEAYFAHDKWAAQFDSVRRWAGKYGYAATEQDGTTVLVPRER